MKNNVSILSLLVMLVCLSLAGLTTSCGNKTEEKKTEEGLGEMADTSAGKPGSPGYDAMQAEDASNKADDEQGMSEEVQAKATGDWVMMKDGKVYAELKFKYIEKFKDPEFTLVWGSKKTKISGTMGLANDVAWMYTGHKGCDISMRTDGTKFFVSAPGNPFECEGTNESPEGEYTRK